MKRRCFTKMNLLILALTAVVFLATVFSCAAHIKWVLEPGIPVYMYHCIAEEPREGDPELYVTPKSFEDHLLFLKEKGYTTIFANEIQEASGYDKPVVITLDDGYEDNYTEAFPILKKLNMKATIFVVGSYIGTGEYLKPEQIKEMSDSGLVSIQSHTWNHVNLAKLPENELDEEFRKSQEVLQQITEKPVNVISYPGGFYDKAVIDHGKRFFEIGYSVNSLNMGYAPWFEISRGGVYRSTELWSIEGSLNYQARNRLRKAWHYWKQRVDKVFDEKGINLAT